MGDVEAEHVGDPEEPLPAEPSGPLLRDPPPPPGYVNPLEQSELLEEPFGNEA